MGIAPSAGPGVTRALPAWAWLALPALALWPVWRWAVARMGDGSDDPWGAVALVVLLACLWRDRHALLAAPRLPGLLASLGLTAAALLVPGVPALGRGLLAVLAVLVMAFALRRPGQPLLAWLGLGVLALPILASLQFFIGYPLRVITAEASLWALRGLGFAVTRQGSALEVGGQLVMVDAPCSGVQMAWAAYFVAFTAAAWLRVADARLLRRLPWLSLLILGANALRNTLLVLQEAGHWQGPAWLHEGIGLAVFAALCGLVLRLVVGLPAQPANRADGLPGAGRPWPWGALFIGLAAYSLVPGAGGEGARPAGFFEWPSTFEGQTLRPLALTAVERRFAEDFPGRLARFAAGPRTLVLRQVQVPTRKLHPAADCYRALGFRISAIALHRRASGEGLQRCFLASAASGRLRVCEYIEDAAGRSFSDTSAWYWSALAGTSPGPWRAVTVAEAAGL